MKPKDKERLVRCRPTLLQSLDVDSLLPNLEARNVFSPSEVAEIKSDSRRRHRIIQFLDLLEKKKTDKYTDFLEVLSDSEPQLYLLLTDEDFEGNPSDMHGALNPSYSLLSRARDYLIQEIDAEKLLDTLDESILSSKEKAVIRNDQDMRRRTEAFLDMLEMKDQSMFDRVVEAMADIYPHVYLTIKNPHAEDMNDDFGDLYD